jgi:hypothetical protein
MLVLGALAAVGVGLLLPAPKAGVNDFMRPGVYSQQLNAPPKLAW